MGHLQVAHVDYYLPDGRMLLSDVNDQRWAGRPRRVEQMFDTYA